MTEAMKQRLRDAYRSPAKGGLFYSANSAETASVRLNAQPYWDWTPVRTNYVGGVSTCMFAEGMGCDRQDLGDGQMWIHKRITEPAQVRDIEIPSVHARQPGEVLANLKRQVQDLPPGEMVRCADIQSPLGVAELMWDSSFYIALIQHPDPVHELLDKVTDYIIAFIKEYQRIAGDRLNPCGFPCVWADGPGTMIADDTMSLVSPEMHAEFSLPYVNRIADACGPVYYHSCTWREAYFENVHQVRNVASYNWACGDSVDFAIIAREFGGRAMLAPHLVIDMHREKGALEWGRSFQDEFAFFRYMVESRPDDAAMYFWFSNIVRKADIIEKIYDYLNALGVTPEQQLS